MKKLIIIIIILAIIFGGMIVYKNVETKTNNVSMQEVEEIENYLDKMYMWKEITKEALPNFQEINQANEDWIWQVVKKNLEDYELSYEQIKEKARELFGKNFTKEFPKEGTEYLTYNEENDRYYAVEINLDQQEDMYLLNRIEAIDEGYEVEIIEYLEDYSQTSEEGENDIIVRNIKGEERGKISSKKEEQIKEIVKNNRDSFSKKKVVLKRQEERLCIEKVY